MDGIGFIGNEHSRSMRRVNCLYRGKKVYVKFFNRNQISYMLHILTFLCVLHGADHTQNESNYITFVLFIYYYFF